MFFSLLRIHQWTKNFLILSNGIFFHQYSIFLNFNLIYSFFSFCLIASSGYIINDLLDYKNDLNHPQKKIRPIQAGKISKINAIYCSCILFILANLLATNISVNFTILINIYFIISIIYSIFFKKIFFIDLIFISLMLFLRIFSGEYIYDIDTSIYLTLISFTLFLTLLSLKRLSELRVSGNQYYKTKKYNEKNILTIFYVSFLGSVLVLTYYFIFGDGKIFYKNNIIFFIISIYAFWIFHLKNKANNGKIKVDPFLFCLKDLVSIIFSFFILTLILFFGK